MCDKKSAFMYNYKYLEIPIWSTAVLYLRRENRFLHAICHDYNIAIHSLSMHQLLNGKLAEFLEFLDSFFTGLASTTCTPIGMEGGGGGEPQSGGLILH